MRSCFGLFLLLGLTTALPASAKSTRRTDWQVQSSMKYDAICLLNVLSGDPYYLDYYKADYERMAPRLTAEEKAEFVALKGIIKDENQGIISAELALVLSVAPTGDTLDDLLSALDRPDDIRSRFSKTQYYSPESFEVFLQSPPHVMAALRALKRIHFEEDWKKDTRPHIDARIREVSSALNRCNIVQSVEQVLGRPLSSR